MNSPNRSRCALTLSFDGEATSGHSMNVRDWAPALVGLSKLFDRANYLVYRNATSVDLKITASHPGSLENDFAIELLRLSTGFLAGDLITSAVVLRQMIVDSISLLKRSRGELDTVSDQSVEEAAQTLESLDITATGIRAELSADNMRELGPQLIRLARDGSYRRALASGVKPLRQSGIDRISIKDKDEVLESIEHSDLPYIVPSEGPMEYVFPWKELQLIAPNLDTRGRSTKWRLRDGTKINSYTIKDEQFLEQVRNRARVFAAGDVIECEVRFTETIKDDGAIKRDYEIVQVFSHRPGDINSSPLLL